MVLKPCAPFDHSHRLPRLFFLALLLLGWAGLAIPVSPAQAQFETMRDLVPDALQQRLFGSTAYSVSFQGDLDSELRDVLRSVSETYALRHHLPATPEMLDRRARGDIPNLMRGLRSEGFYAGRIEVDVDHAASPPEVLFHIQPGPEYSLAAVHFDGPTSEEWFDFSAPTPDTVGLAIGRRARGPEIQRGIASLRDFFRENGHPFPWVDLREAVVDHAARTMTVFYAFSPGPHVLFGPVTVEGEDRVDPAHILNKVPWTAPQAFQTSQLNRLRSDLMLTGLFTVVNVTHPNTPADDGTLPITISVVERVPRTIRAGVGYETDTGFGTALEWEHRNILGRGEQLRTRLQLAEKKQTFETAFQVPEFPDPTQSLTIQGLIGQEETDALKKKEIGIGAMVNRQMGRHWSVSLGTAYRYSEVTQLGETQTFALLSTPGEVIWDRRNHVLNPTRGWRAQVRAEPFLDTLDWQTTFLKLSGALSAHMPILPEERLVLAARGALGSIMGQANLSLPADQRFYAGGGGSVRGYAFQSIGPELDGEIVGGRSMVEVGTELRLRMDNNFGLVAFLDGGQVFTESELQFQDDFLWGAGLGLRYHLEFGPIRLDLAFPLNRRDRDDAFQVYFSIGQAY
ncbi:MAG: outer membrane protein assembly factor [Desulfovibrionales bacterium]|nr:MAG: outer membrane protein assembly factor [Desulfovibrionales bacterium]